MAGILRGRRALTASLWRLGQASGLHHSAINASECSTSGYGRGMASAAEDQGASFTAHLQSRTVIALTGPDAVAFLQGMVTNDMRPLEAAQGA